jgi:transglutaminase/protease-like cytokinesis protein 3
MALNGAADIIVCVALLFTIELGAQAQDIRSSDFRKADSMALLFPKHSLRDLRLLAQKLTMPLATEPEKFRAIYRWICNNIDYDYNLFLVNKRKREKLTDAEDRRTWNTKISAAVFETMVKEHRSVCTGYAYLVRELSYHAGLSCRIVDGFGLKASNNGSLPQQPNHTWNEIQLQGTWYPCDATWSSGALDSKTFRYIKRYDDTYFLQARDQFVKRHVPVEAVANIE